MKLNKWSINCIEQFLGNNLFSTQKLSLKIRPRPQITGIELYLTESCGKPGNLKQDVLKPGHLRTATFRNQEIWKSSNFSQFFIISKWLRTVSEPGHFKTRNVQKMSKNGNRAPPKSPLSSFPTHFPVERGFFTYNRNTTIVLTITLWTVVWGSNSSSVACSESIDVSLSSSSCGLWHRTGALFAAPDGGLLARFLFAPLALHALGGNTLFWLTLTFLFSAWRPRGWTGVRAWNNLYETMWPKTQS